MSDLRNTVEKPPNNDEYNEIPVYYCAHCLSLKIMRVAGMDDACYCEDCGNTDCSSTGIFEWEKMYKDRYGLKFLDNSFK